MSGAYTKLIEERDRLRIAARQDAEMIVRLREALEPFARLYAETIDDGYHTRSIPATDLRRARAALARGTD